MNHNDVMKLVNSIERDLPVDQWTHRGVQIWPLMRFEIFRQSEKRIFDGANGWSGIFIKFPPALRSFLDALKVCLVRPSVFLNLFGKTQVLVASHSSFQKYAYSGKIFDPYADRNILEEREAGHKTQKWEFNGLCPLNLSGSLLGFPWALFFYPLKIISRLRDKTLGTNLNHPAFLEMAKKIGTDPAQKMQSSVMASANTISLVSKFLVPILKWKSVKKLLVTAYYSEPQMSLILAARHLGIPSIDLQHGVQARDHKAYGSWKKIPLDGFGILPDQFAVWSNVEMQIQKEWSLSPIQKPGALMIGPSPLVLLKKLGANDPIPEWLSQLRLQNSKIALLSVQPTVDFVSFLKESPRVSDYFWLIRLHPRMKGEISKIAAALAEIPNLQFEVVKSTSETLFPLLETCDMHVTGYSTVATEASWFGKKTMTIHPFGPQCFPELVDAGFLSPWETGF